MNRQKTGSEFESYALSYLNKNGLALIEKHFWTRVGEIDLIMRDGNCLVFVEVRYKKQDYFVSPAESITPHKISCLKQAALLYLQKNPPQGKFKEIRFDFVGITGEEDDLKFEWIKRAFE